MARAVSCWKWSSASGAAHDADVAVADALHLGVDPVPLALEFGEPYLRVRLGLLDQRLEDGEDAGQPRLGGDEVPAAQALHPADHVLGGGGEVVAGLVLALDVVFPQPGPFRRGPVVQVFRRRAGEPVLAVGIPQAEEHIVQGVDELLAADVALVRLRERRHEERDRERGVLGAEQGPSCVVFTQGIDRVVVHGVLGCGVIAVRPDSLYPSYREPPTFSVEEQQDDRTFRLQCNELVT